VLLIVVARWQREHLNAETDKGEVSCTKRKQKGVTKKKQEDGVHARA